MYFHLLKKINVQNIFDSNQQALCHCVLAMPHFLLLSIKYVYGAVFCQLFSFYHIKLLSSQVHCVCNSHFSHSVVEHFVPVQEDMISHKGFS